MCSETDHVATGHKPPLVLSAAKVGFEPKLTDAARRMNGASNKST